jgi:hypothetical protein
MIILPPRGRAATDFYFGDHMVTTGK